MLKGQPVLKFQFANKLLKIKERSQENIRKKDQEKELIRQKQQLLQAEFESFQIQQKVVDIKNIKEIEQNLKRIKDECVSYTNQQCKKLNNTLIQYQQATQAEQSEIVEQFHLNNSSFNKRHKQNKNILSFMNIPKQTKIPIQQDDEEKLKKRLQQLMQEEQKVNEKIIKNQSSQVTYDNLLMHLQKTKQFRNVDLQDVKMKKKIIDSQNHDLSILENRASEHQSNYQLDVNKYKQNLNIIEIVEKNKLQQMKREDIEQTKLQSQQMYDQAIIEKESQIIKKKLSEQQQEMEKLDIENEEKIHRKAESVQIIEDIEIIHRLIHIFRKKTTTSKKGSDKPNGLQRGMSEFQRQSTLLRSKTVEILVHMQNQNQNSQEGKQIEFEVKADSLTSIDEEHESKSSENVFEKIEYLENLKEQPLNQHIKVNEEKFLRQKRRQSQTNKTTQNNIVIVKNPNSRGSLQMTQIRQLIPEDQIIQSHRRSGSSFRSDLAEESKKIITQTPQSFSNVSQKFSQQNNVNIPKDENMSDISGLQQEIEKSQRGMTGSVKKYGKRWSMSIQKDSERIQIMSKQLQKHKISQTTQQILEKINEFYTQHNDPHQVAEMLIKQYNLMLSSSNSLQKIFEYFNHERQVLLIFSDDLDKKVHNLKNIYYKEQNLYDDYQENFSNEKPQDTLQVLIQNNDSILELKRKNHMVIINSITQFSNIVIRYRSIINNILQKTSNRNEKVFRVGIENMSKFINEYKCGYFAKRQQSNLLVKEQYVKQIEEKGVKILEGGDQQKRIDRIFKSLNYTAFYPLTKIELKKQFLEVFPRKNDLCEDWLKIVCNDILLFIFQSKESLQKGLIDTKQQVGNFNLKKNEFQTIKLAIENLQNFSINFAQNLLKQGIQYFSQIIETINSQNALYKQNKNLGFKSFFFKIGVGPVKVKQTRAYQMSPENKQKINSIIEKGCYHYQIRKKSEQDQNNELELNFNKIQKIQNNILQDLKSQQQSFNDENYKDWINKQTDTNKSKNYQPFKEGQEVLRSIQLAESKKKAENFAKLSEKERENLYIDHQRTHVKISNIYDEQEHSQYDEQFEPLKTEKEEPPQKFDEVEEKYDDFAHLVNSVHKDSIMFDKLNSIDSKLLKRKEDNSKSVYNIYIPDIIKKDIVKIKRIQSSNLLRKKVLNSVHQTPVMLRSPTAKIEFRSQKKTKKRALAQDTSSSSNSSVRLNQFVENKYRQQFNIEGGKKFLRNNQSAKAGNKSAKLDKLVKDDQSKSTNIFSLSQSTQKKILLSKKLSDIYQF